MSDLRSKEAWSTLLAHGRKELLVEALLEADEPLTLRELSEKTELPNGTTREIAAELREEGRLECQEDGWAKRHRVAEGSA